MDAINDPLGIIWRRDARVVVLQNRKSFQDRFHRRIGRSFLALPSLFKYIDVKK